MTEDSDRKNGFLGFFKRKPEGGSEEQFEEEIISIVDELIISLDEFNADDAESCLKKLSGANLDYDRTKAVETASEMLALFKYDEVKTLIENTFMMK